MRLLTTVLIVLGAASEIAAAEEIDFRRDVAAILETKCLRCHQATNKKGDFSLSTREDAFADGYIVPGKPQESRLMEVVSPAKDGKKPLMPKEGVALSAAQVKVLRQWIANGANWPKTITLRARTRGDKNWWSLLPIANRPPPKNTKAPASWRANPIDRFLFAQMKSRGLSPSKPASRRVLIRRLNYDLLGLPPSPAEVKRFVEDPLPDDLAYERLVDRLLASPHYGERWGRHWLDVARFGESNGFERNILIHNLWPYRDYVIRSFNADKPFDRFAQEQLAGDALSPGDPNVEIATAFLVCGPYDNVGNQDPKQAAQIRANTIDEMVRATGEAFLGITIGCARCHDHKFDAILQKDYYAMSATFSGVRHGSRVIANATTRKQRAEKLRPLQARRGELLKQIAQKKKAKQPFVAISKELAKVDARIRAVPNFPNWWVGIMGRAPAKSFVFLGGDPQRRGEEVTASSLAVLTGRTSPFRTKAGTPERSRRLALAKWITQPGNPLTARVLVNRVWQHHFGTGIVSTPSDFGAMGTKPTHPHLLDWLARRFVSTRSEGGFAWRLKPLHRLIVTSAAYRQASRYRKSQARIDADARFLWRYPPRRLGAEAVRDTMLHAAGKLKRRMFGPGFQLYKYVQDNVATYHPLDVHGPETYRRSVYHKNARAARTDIMSDFDCPDPASAAPRRASTTTPLQALTMLNHRFSLDMANAFAARIQKTQATPEAQVRKAFEVAYSREPGNIELAAAVKLVQKHGLRALTRALLNSNELLSIR